MASIQGFGLVLSGALFIGVLASTLTGVQSIGVCYGMTGNDLPSHGDVVQLYKASGISHMRVYNPNAQLMDALRGSGIGLILGVTNQDVGSLATSHGQAFAASWVQANVKPYYPAVNVTYVAVGNEVEDGAAGGILPAMENLKGALAAAGLAGIKVSTCVRFDVITGSFPPSAAGFAKPYMGGVAKFLADTGAPLLANVYPYFAYKDNAKDIPLSYALFQPGKPVRDDGNGLTYTNLFDAMVDAVYAALEKAGAPGVRVVVAESGWPSAGGAGATVQNAQTYMQNLINHAAMGTPKKPGAALETFLFAMFNENQKPGDPTEKNFGLFYPNKSHVYPIIFR
ncbi:hypothetical protein ACP70R_036094 [Stipagrostis hirtigluma subsp. patula]